MEKRDLHFILMAFLLIGLLVVLSLTGKPRYLPADKVHRTATTDAMCIACHNKTSEYPMSKEHPPKYKKCYLCHKKKRG